MVCCLKPRTGSKILRQRNIDTTKYCAPTSDGGRGYGPGQASMSAMWVYIHFFITYGRQKNLFQLFIQLVRSHGPHGPHGRMDAPHKERGSKRLCLPLPLSLAVPPLLFAASAQVSGCCGSRERRLEGDAPSLFRTCEVDRSALTVHLSADEKDFAALATEAAA